MGRVTEQRESRVRTKAMLQDRYGKPEEVLRPATIDLPPVGADDVLVRMRATSVNTPDWLTVTGVPYFVRLQAGLRRPAAPVRGTDVAGVVEEVGSEVSSLKPGDEVFGSWWDGGLDTRGTFAEHGVGPASGLIEKPAGVSFEEAAASGMSALTALSAMRDAGNVGPDSRVLINGASGGVGTYAVQIAKHLGAEVTGVSSTRNLELVRELGADHVIDYTQEDFTRGGSRYDVILDNVMNHSPARTARVLAPNGTLLPNSVGTKGGFFGALPRMGRAALMGRGKTNVEFVGGWVGNRENLEAVAELLATGAIKPVIGAAFSLEEAGKAVAHMMGHHARGNIVITM